MSDVEYAGFWIRTGAALIDGFLWLMLVLPALAFIYGQDYWLSDAFLLGFWDFAFNYALPAVVVVLFWLYKSATPGKLLLRLAIVDARTGTKPSVGQFIGRYAAYYIAVIPLFLGIIWVGFDRRKQGWHDKLAGTVVVRDVAKEPVRFEAQEPSES